MSDTTPIETATPEKKLKKFLPSKKTLTIVGATLATTVAAGFAIAKFSKDDENDDSLTIEAAAPFEVEIDVTDPTQS